MQMQLVITVEDDGRVQVSGPIDNKMVAYGLLEVARDAINDYAKGHSKLVVPTVLNGLHSNGHKEI